ncbi:hypothetical protein IEO21_03124 [Rhodonia placenta]|uniref:Uncharacterized protein n=1 Tax=Rhodonia placenta TaxID=104341 RepID=A0A8H7P6C2_9APHY|nr:hypothetical protein IEO21_03124 [Postia placenta]
MFIRELNECTAEQLRAIGHITRNTPDHNLGSAMESLRLNTKLKVAVHLLKPAIDRPVDAAVYLVEVIDFVKRTSHGADPFVKQREIFLIFAGALVRSGTNDKDAQAILERLAQINDASTAGLKALVATKVYLARVLRRREKTKAAEKHEEWLTKWFRKNPHLISEHALRLLLLPPGETGGSPVLDALGGPSWLDSRQHTDKTDLRLAKQCRQCGACEPMTKLAFSRLPKGELAVSQLSLLSLSGTGVSE